jgi:hypothetical protein
MRRMAAAKSPLPEAAGPPNSRAARAASRQARAARITALEGTQPTFRQSPPIRCLSIRATFAPRPAAAIAATRPAGPAPTTTRW